MNSNFEFFDFKEGEDVMQPGAHFIGEFVALHEGGGPGVDDAPKELETGGYGPERFYCIEMKDQDGKVKLLSRHFAIERELSKATPGEFLYFIKYEGSKKIDGGKRTINEFTIKRKANS